MRNSPLTDGRGQKLRQSWNKYNLWNLKSFRLPTLLRRTFFQQKWTAKAMMRAYHGEHVKERQWERMFSRRLNSVVNMEPRYMAEHDGSEQAAGRGSGREPAPLHPGQRTSWEEIYARSPSNRTVLGDTPTPHMQMAFAPLERRLDTAVFRAMFASSARQARQFVVHGGVTVNGQKVRPPLRAFPSRRLAIADSSGPPGEPPRVPPQPGRHVPGRGRPGTDGHWPSQGASTDRERKKKEGG